MVRPEVIRPPAASLAPTIRPTSLAPTIDATNTMMQNLPPLPPSRGISFMGPVVRPTIIPPPPLPRGPTGIVPGTSAPNAVPQPTAVIPMPAGVGAVPQTVPCGPPPLTVPAVAGGQQCASVSGAQAGYGAGAVPVMVQFVPARRNYGKTAMNPSKRTMLKDKEVARRVESLYNDATCAQVKLFREKTRGGFCVTTIAKRADQEAEVCVCSICMNFFLLHCLCFKFRDDFDLFFGHMIECHLHPGSWTECRALSSADPKKFYKYPGVSRNWSSIKTYVVRSCIDKNEEEMQNRVPYNLRTFQTGVPDIWDTKSMPLCSRALSKSNNRCVCVCVFFLLTYGSFFFGVSDREWFIKRWKMCWKVR